MNPTRPYGARIALALAAVGCAAVGDAPAAEEPGLNVRDMKLFRFEFDNDTFVGSDDAFTAGWSIQVHSPMLDEWSPGLERWIGRLPTLSDDDEGERIVRTSWGVTQLIITPDDVTIAAPQLDDAPWAGLLGGYVSWSAYDNRRLAALQVYVGCIGPCSHAEDVQKFVHSNLDFGERPEGWSNQLDDEFLVNLNYEYRRKVWASAARYDSSRLGNDLSVGAQVGIGGFATYAEAWIEYRFGWDIPQGFTKFADPPALGIALDPVYLDPSGPEVEQRRWRFYFNLVARVRSFDEFVATEGGDTQNGGFYPQIVASPGDEQVIVGFHVAKIPLAIHLTYYRYLDDGDVTGVMPTELDWVNLSFERRF
jgi:hypothetical protein